MPVANPVYNALYDVIKSLPEENSVQVLNYASYLKSKVTQKSECPICANNIPNAETIAAIQEGRAMMRGEIPAKRFSSLEEMWEDLEKHDSIYEPNSAAGTVTFHRTGSHSDLF